MMYQEAERLQMFTRRALLLGTAQALTFGVIGTRLYSLQVQRRDQYALLAEDNRASQRLLMPPRGTIKDVHGRILAENIPTYRVRVIREDAGDLDFLLERLGQLVPLTESQIQAVTRQARNYRSFVPITVAEGLNWKQISAIAVHSPDLPGVVLDAGLLRHYPHEDVLAHVVGYVGPVSESDISIDQDPLLRLPEFRIGKSGIEKTYDQVLRGTAGHSRVEVNAVGREIRELNRQEGKNGTDVTLTLDIDLQKFCFERLSAELSASAAVIDVNDGSVLALTSVPSYDPAGFASGLNHREWRELRDNPRTPLVNKTIRGQYPPGSTFKMITALAALNKGAITPSYEAFCPGHLSLGNARFHCWKQDGHGRISLLQALGQSCDVFFYEVARKVGVDAIAEMAGKFGLGAPTGIDLPGEAPGLVPTSEWKKATLGESWQRGETLVIGIGQGYMLATPLQLAVMAARLANGGIAVTPSLREKVSSDSVSDAPEFAHVDVSAEALSWVRKGMYEVVNGPRGTARSSALKLEGIEMAGKTGTSQVRRINRAERAAGLHKRKDRPWDDRDHALFVCFAPFDKPKFAVSVVVEHGQSGSGAAAPIARDIMTKALQLDQSQPRLIADTGRFVSEG